MSVQVKYLIGFGASFMFFVLGEILRRQAIRKAREEKVWLTAIEQAEKRYLSERHGRHD